MKRRTAVSRGWRAVVVLVLVMIVAVPVVAAQDRARTQTRSAKERAEQKTRSTSDQRSRSERTAEAARSQRAERASDAKQRKARRDSEARTEAARTGARPNRSDTRQNRSSAARRSSTAPRQETQRQRRTPVRRQPPKAAKPPLHRKPKGKKRTKPRKGLSIDIDLAWPWPHRHRRAWKPRYRYRQVVHVRSVWGRHRRSTRIDVRTRYHHRVRWANAHRAEVDVYLDAIELYAGGRYLGTVDRIPAHLRRVRATLYRDGRARFDRELFLVGDPHVGFELIATRPYDDYVLGTYRRGDWVKAGAVDLYAGEVVPMRRSRLFRPHDFDGWAPVSLLPEDIWWRIDVGIDAVSARPYHAASEPYEGGKDYYYGPASADNRREKAVQSHEPLHRTRDDTFRLEAGVRVDMTREVHLERLQ